MDGARQTGAVDRLGQITHLVRPACGPSLSKVVDQIDWREWERGRTVSMHFQIGGCGGSGTGRIKFRSDTFRVPIPHGQGRMETFHREDYQFDIYFPVCVGYIGLAAAGVLTTLASLAAAAAVAEFGPWASAGAAAATIVYGFVASFQLLTCVYGTRVHYWLEGYTIGGIISEGCESV